MLGAICIFPQYIYCACNIYIAMAGTQYVYCARKLTQYIYIAHGQYAIYILRV